MARKGNGFGKIVAFATIAGAVAAGISYFTKYKSFHKELEEDFHDFEDDGNDDISRIDSTMNRNYVSLHADKDELKVAASDMVDAAKDAVDAAKNLVKDAAGIMTDTARETAYAAKDVIGSAMDRAEEDEPEDEEKPAGQTEEAIEEEDYADGGLKEAAGTMADDDIKEDADTMTDSLLRDAEGTVTDAPTTTIEEDTE